MPAVFGRRGERACRIVEGTLLRTERALTPLSWRGIRMLGALVMCAIVPRVVSVDLNRPRIEGARKGRRDRSR